MWDTIFQFLTDNDQPISAHYVRGVMFVLWLPFLLIRMPLVDRRDVLTALDYIAYGITSGVIMLWGITAVLPVPSNDHDLQGHAMWFAIIALLTMVNYLRAPRDSRIFEQHRMADAAKK